MKCECQYSKGKAYQQCTQEAKYINYWGWYMCEEHKSVADIHLNTKNKINKDEITKRIKNRELI